MISILVFLFWLISPQASTLPQSSRASVSGITRNEMSIEPLGQVTVTLMPLDSPSSLVSAIPVPSTIQPGGRGGVGRGAVIPIAPVSNPEDISVSSDSQGNFVFPNVPPGRYRISAERDGFFREERYRAGTAGSLDPVLTLIEGQKVEHLILAMTEVPPIAGRIYGLDGQGLASAVVHAYKVQYTPYGRQLELVASVLSHEGGEYRLFHLAPGNYVVSASLDGGHLDGAIYDTADHLHNGAKVVLVPDSARRNFPNQFLVTESRDGGRFVMTGIPPGEYKLFAWQNVEANAYMDTIFMENYERLGVTVKIPPSSAVTVSTRVIPID